MQQAAAFASRGGGRIPKLITSGLLHPPPRARQGILAALLLGVLGASPDQIVADYHRSDEWHHVALAGIENDSRVVRRVAAAALLRLLRLLHRARVDRVDPASQPPAPRQAVNGACLRSRGANEQGGAAERWAGLELSVPRWPGSVLSADWRE